ncbi:unnamed protein product [Blepharisma stoltei]|uniref:Acyl-coenzyme A oxidase n=1 Tax=Blepharisma stoltei TaxID=1481888 RepID=A0AAU9JEV9_9CILI|nr:unnamed protein product [Blepharisma stoltei]
MEATRVRLNLINSHLLGSFQFESKDLSLDEYRARGKKFNKTLLHDKMLEPFGEMYKLQWSLIKEREDLFNHCLATGLSKDALEERSIRQFMYLFPKCGLTLEEDLKNPLKKLSIVVSFCTNDINLTSRGHMQLLLYAEMLTYLSTEKHANLIKRAYELKDFGCLGMTEIGHGSNLAKVETTAKYDIERKEFTITSPTPTAAKWWIGNAGKIANMAIIFAQLIIKDTNYGVHAFVVQVRDNQTHETLNGITVGNCGPMAGLNGNDTGFLIFKNYKAPYDCLLDRFAQITPEGDFKSSIKSHARRFGITVSPLICGRIVCFAGTENYARNALTIAIRYAAIRKQFGGDTEKSILDYQLHRYRLMPHLATLFASNMATKLIAKAYNESMLIIRSNPESNEISDFSWLVTIFKAVNVWNNLKTIQECREACGGHGYSTYAGFIKLKQDCDAIITTDGDSNILIQSAERYILQAAQAAMGGKTVKSKYLQFINLQPTKPKFENKDQLKNPEFLVSLFEYRCNYYLSIALNKFQENMGNYPSMAIAWDNTQVRQLFVLPQICGELVLLKELINFKQELAQTCANTGDIILSILVLYANHILETDSGALKTQFTEDEVKWINEIVVEYCNEVGENSVNIIDALAFPDHVIASPLGHSDGQIYERYTKVVEDAPECYEKPKWINIVQENRRA